MSDRRPNGTAPGGAREVDRQRLQSRRPCRPRPAACRQCYESPQSDRCGYGTHTRAGVLPSECGSEEIRVRGVLPDRRLRVPANRPEREEPRQSQKQSSPNRPNRRFRKRKVAEPRTHSAETTGETQPIQQQTTEFDGNCHPSAVCFGFRLKGGREQDDQSKRAGDDQAISPISMKLAEEGCICAKSEPLCLSGQSPNRARSLLQNAPKQPGSPASAACWGGKQPGSPASAACWGGKQQARR